MSPVKYQVIARRYRPRRFDEVVGQESVGTTLRNAILQDRLAHAYLFAGPRGVGKTSMARIFAKALDCPRAADRARPRESWGLPCDECDVCRAIHTGEDIDVLEVDGASYRGIDDIRDIVENVKFTPSRSPYKIFIIDEVHMLTREAFNALLKTLEEPPAHVKFIFATTEAHKIPETVLSRCQRFDFRPIGEADIVKRLGQICREEGVKAEPGLLEKIARYGKGGLRDAQTLLDQAITFSSGTLESADLERITGRLPEEAIDGLVEAVAGRDPPAALRALSACFAAGADPATLLDQVIERLHDRLVSTVVGEGGAPAPPPDPAELDLSLGRLQVLHEAALKLRGSPYPRLAVELALMKLSRMEDPGALEQALLYLKSIEGRPGGSPAHSARATDPPPPPARRVQPPEPPRGAAPPEPGAFTRASPEGAAGGPQAGPIPGPAGTSAGATPPAAPPDFGRLRSLWDQILIECRQRSPQTGAFLTKAKLREGKEAGRFTVVLDSEFALKQLREPRRAQEFEALVAEVTGAPFRMALELEAPRAVGEAPASGRGSGPGKAGAAGKAGGRGEGPAIQDDPLVKKSVDLFKGRIL